LFNDVLSRAKLIVEPFSAEFLNHEQNKKHKEWPVLRRFDILQGRVLIILVETAEKE
jgi:hypothetical protein